MGPQLHQLKFSIDILRRGFWLYVWRIKLKDGSDLHYVGRTGDSSSLKAQSPFSRVSGHLGPNKNANALRKHLSKRGIDFDVCETLELITFGPIYPEGANEGEHKDRRNKVHALERDLCEAMKSAGYSVMNTVPCRLKTNPTEWERVRKNFQTHLKRLVA